MQQESFGSVIPRESLDSKHQVSGTCGAERDFREGSQTYAFGDSLLHPFILLCSGTYVGLDLGGWFVSFLNRLLGVRGKLDFQNNS